MPAVRRSALGLAALSVVALLTTVAHADVPIIAPADLGATAVAALAAADPAHAPRGAAEVIAWSGAVPDLDAARQAVMAAVTAAGLTVVDPGEPTGPIRLTVEDARGARATIAQDADSGGVSLVARPAHVTPPGRCVVPPAPVWDATVHAGGVDQLGEFHQRDITWRLTTARLADVDGDGVLDAFVPLHATGQCPEDGLYEVYVMRGRCGHRVGRVGPGNLDAATAPVARSGYRPLTFVRERTRRGAGGIPDMVRTTTQFRFVGKTYRASKPVTTAGRCHHCAIWTCTSP